MSVVSDGIVKAWAVAAQSSRRSVVVIAELAWQSKLFSQGAAGHRGVFIKLLLPATRPGTLMSLGGKVHYHLRLPVLLLDVHACLLHER